LEHGYFEILQGNIRPESLYFFPSMGAPCVPEKVWNACEPAMTVLPSFLAAGILTVILGLVILIWSAAFIQRKRGGVVLIGLSVLLILFGGGFFPPLFGVIGGAVGLWINRPLHGKRTGRILRFVATIWPWPLVIFMAWALGQFLVGYFFNDFLKSMMGPLLLVVLAMLPLTVYCGYARDVEGQASQLTSSVVEH
jgi:hypothetical protein